MQSIDRVMKIASVFISANSIPYLSITELSSQCGLPVSSLHRILQGMIKHKLIKQDKERKLYTLGSGWLEYGLKIYDTMDYISYIRPELEQLMRSVDSSVYLLQPDLEESIVIERIDCINQTIRTYDKLGLRIPFPKGIANLVMLANMDESKQQLWPHLENKFKEIKTQGYAFGEDEWSEGIVTIATAIVNHYGKVFGALCVKLAKTDDQNEYKKVIKELVDTGNQVSWKID